VLPDDPSLRIEPGGPARVLAVLLPIGAILLVAVGSARGAMARTAEDPLPPWFVAVLTVAGAAVLGRRAWTQRATLDRDGIVSRNLTSTVRLPWSTVESLHCLHRTGVLIVEIRLAGTRRRLRLGPATRWWGPEAERMIRDLESHPCAGALVERDGP
jgi:hypothetical protein